MAEVVKLPIVPMLVFAVAILDALDAISVSFELMFEALVEMLDVLAAISVSLELI